MLLEEKLGNRILQSVQHRKKCQNPYDVSVCSSVFQYSQIKSGLLQSLNNVKT